VKSRSRIWLPSLNRREERFLMSRDDRVRDLMTAFEKTAYFQWMKRQGIPIIEGYGLEDVRDVSLAPWARTGGKAAFVNLYGMEGVTGMVIGEIPAGGALEPEKHFYEEVICILEGQGATEVWQEGGRKQMFEWGAWSLFAPPLNTWHRLINGGREPVKFLAVTNAPLILDTIHNEDFVFNCPYDFSDRYSGAEDFFNVGQKRYEVGMQHIWETNFIMDIQSAALDERTVKGAGVRITQFELSGNSLIGHLAQWPAGRYHKAHYHGAGAILLGLQSSGYVLLWSKELGIRPYEAGHSEDVVEVKWKAGSVYCPPGGWFHQHFNTGPEPARHLAIRYGSRIHPIGFKIADKRSDDGVYIDVKRGGTLIEYADEDPQIRRHYEDELKKTGVACEMPGA
jgi:oxalate decarboxylase/phosphoglucose isomerase-like protein (cupin superfamily)